MSTPALLATQTSGFDCRRAGELNPDFQPVCGLIVSRRKWVAATGRFLQKLPFRLSEKECDSDLAVSAETACRFCQKRVRNGKKASEVKFRLNFDFFANFFSVSNIKFYPCADKPQFDFQLYTPFFILSRGVLRKNTCKTK